MLPRLSLISHPQFASFEQRRGCRIYSIVALICRIDSSVYSENTLSHKQELSLWLFQEVLCILNNAYQRRIVQNLVQLVIYVETSLMVKYSSLYDWMDLLSLFALLMRLYREEISSGSNGILVVRLPYVHLLVKIIGAEVDSLAPQPFFSSQL